MYDWQYTCAIERAESGAEATCATLMWAARADVLMCTNHLSRCCLGHVRLTTRLPLLLKYTREQVEPGDEATTFMHCYKFHTPVVMYIHVYVGRLALVVNECINMCQNHFLETCFLDKL